MAETTWDTIVVGAGSAGGVLAARLSEDPHHRVLLLEAGASDRNLLCRKPGMMSVLHTVPEVKKRFDWGYRFAPRPWTLDRDMPCVRGKVMGGSSAINGMVWVRGHPSDYDAWAADGCPGWGWADLLPAFKRSETFEDGETELRGGSGPIHVQRTRDRSPASQAFMEATAAATGCAVLDDYNGPRQEGVGACQTNARGGVRQSTSEVYVEPARGRPNLEIRSGVLVLRVRVEGGRAVGVEIDDGGGPTLLRAGRVVLSAGAVGSPHLLLLSGVGPADHLRALGLPVHADLPVGENLHDHLFFPLTFLAPRGGHRGTPGHFLWGLVRELLFGGTFLARSVFEVMAFLKSREGLPAPDVQLHVLPWAYPAPNQDAPVRPKVDLRPALTVLATLIRPQSRGTLRLASVDPRQQPVIDPHFLEAQADRETLIAGIELTRRIAGAPPVAGEITQELEPGPSVTGDRLRGELPLRASTVYHPVGTCRMGSDARAVVDPRLAVCGLEGLYVVDASVIPTIPGGNTNAPTIAVAERAATLLRS